MTRWFFVFIFAAICAGAALGCSGSAGSPVTPVENINGALSSPASAHSQTHLWGLYDVYVDVPTQTATAVLNRQAMFTANVVNFVNGKVGALSFKINSTQVIYENIDVDIDVSIMHPFPGLPQYNGYDVRGVFMGDGAWPMQYNGDLKTSLIWSGNNQFMFPDPTDGFGGPDGYTRWYNKPEFSGGGMPLFQYTQGKFATPNYDETATLCPYKYFADGLDTNDDLWNYFTLNPDLNGVFSSGTTHTRNYYLRFPNAVGIKYSYAIIANWENVDVHPSNALEAVACSVTNQSDLFFVSPSQNGGTLKFDISLWDWDSNVSAGVMEDYKIFVESTVLANPHEFSASEMTPIGGDALYSTYHVEIAPDNLNSNTLNEFWVIAECANKTYANDFGVANLAQDDKLAAFFRFDLPVSDLQDNQPPVCDIKVVTPMPKSGYGPQTVEFNASASADPEGQPLTYEWDFDNDGTFGDSYNSGTDAHPFKTFNQANNTQVCVRVTDPDGLSSDCCVDVDINPVSSKNQSLRTDQPAVDLAVDPNNGNLLILYDDGQVWEYTEATYYAQSSASLLFTADIPTSPWNPVARIANYRIDIAPNGNMIAAGYAGSGGWPAGCWNSSGTKIDQAPAPGAGDSVPDVFGFLASGSYANTLAFLCPGNGGMQNNMYRWYGGWQQHYETGGENQSIGYQYVKFSQVTGCVSVSGSQYWVIEDAPDYYASKWVLSGWYHSFNGEWFGTGSQTDADNGWYKAKDLTKDSTGRFYVLDELASGQGRIKLFQAGSPGSALTTHAAGDSSTISEKPLRIEGTDYVSPTFGNLIFALHGNGIPSKLSVFFPSEFGW